MAFDPQKLGRQLSLAGTKQERIGKSMQSAAGHLRDFAEALNTGKTIDNSLGSVRSGAKSIRELLLPVVTALQAIVSALKSVKVPTVGAHVNTFDFPVLGKLKIVTGVDVGETHPFTAIADKIDTVRANVANIGNTLSTIADAIRDLRTELPNIRNALLGTSNDIKSGGSDLIESGAALEDAGTQMVGN